MILYPAIDLKAGQCVRLRQGRMEEATLFNADPAAQAAAFAEQGFDWLHVVDLDGAIAGESANRAAIEAILAAKTGLAVQIGGGIRSMAAIEGWLAAGAARVILGTIAVRDPTLVAAAAARFPGRIVVGIDARAGRVAVQGWAEETDMAAEELARQMADVGVAALIVTDIARDGMGEGVNLNWIGAIADSVPIPVIASGGVSSLADVRALSAFRGVKSGAKIAGAVIGRALYDGAIAPRAALDLAKSAA